MSIKEKTNRIVGQLKMRVMPAQARNTGMGNMGMMKAGKMPMKVMKPMKAMQTGKSAYAGMKKTFGR